MKTIQISDELYSSLKELQEELKEEYKEYMYEVKRVKIKVINQPDFEAWCNSNFSKIPIRRVRRFENQIFITRKSAKEYIKYKSHHIIGDNPVTYAIMPYGDLQEVLNLFLTIKVRESK